MIHPYTNVRKVRNNAIQSQQLLGNTSPRHAKLKQS